MEREIRRKWKKKEIRKKEIEEERREILKIKK